MLFFLLRGIAGRYRQILSSYLIMLLVFESDGPNPWVSVPRIWAVDGVPE